MLNLEGRFDAIVKRWPGAVDVKEKLTALRKTYEQALEARQAGMQAASNLRAARNAAHEDFLDVYAEVAGRVKAEFPRNRRMQELFFDRISERADGVEEEPEDDAEVPAETTPAK